MFKMKMNSIISLTLTMALAAVMSLGACSSKGGDDAAPAPAAPAPAVSIGTMTKGSVIVNGVQFEDTAASIIADDTPKVLADGMTVKVKGTINDDGLTGKAEKIEVDNEVRGALTKTGVDTFTVNGQTVLKDGATIFAGGVTGFESLLDGQIVEVHGQRDAAGVIRATRIEKQDAGVQDEVRGVVSGKTASSFVIGNLTITIGSSTFMVPAGATFADGDIVEVHLNGTLATRIELEDAEFEPAEGQKFEVEGFISGFSDLNSSFKVNDQVVQTSSSTRFDGGLKSELANDIKVEAEGHLSNGILVAKKIAFKETVRIESNAALAGTANLLGKTVLVTSKTEFQGLTGVSDITPGVGLRVRGFVNNDGSITATRVIKQSNPVDAGKDILQGPVSSKNSSAKSLVILGITVSIASNASSMDDSPDDNNVAFANIDAFLAAVTEGRTIVKAKGTFSGSTLAATELEIE